MLALVLLFVVAVGITLVQRSRTAPLESPGPTPSTADLRLKGVEIEEESGRVRWRLTAEQALIFEQEGRTNLRKIAVKVDEPDRSWTIVGEEGDLYQQTKNLEVRRNVILTSSDGLRLETTVLRWHGEERRLWTDAPVRLSRQRTVIHGTALDVRMGEETTMVTGPVRATFTGGRAQ
ncbi:MAG: LPS export ABC transporter periplasmic protein LptC [Candidatus Rokubacteria bacterium]|nr:LPS export ABC transporter periplasmic protein LptC [Candidatus Rokubacteria bacterium]